MHAIRRQTPPTRPFAVATIVVLALLSSLAPAARATVPDACGLITEHRLARAFGLANAIKHKSLITQPENASGVLRQTCRVFAWRGRKPNNAKQKRAALLEGRMARINIRTWVPDEGANSRLWRMRFDSAVKAQRGAASALFLKKLHGRRLVPPRFDADYSIAFQAVTGRVRRARGLWWNRADKTLISMNVLEAKDKAAVASLKSVAAVIVPAFKP